MAHTKRKDKGPLEGSKALGLDVGKETPKEWNDGVKAKRKYFKEKVGSKVL